MKKDSCVDKMMPFSKNNKIMDLPGIEPGAPCMRSKCDTTTPQTPTCK